MDFRELFLSQHARAHSYEVAYPDFSNQDLILRGLKEEDLRIRPVAGLNTLAWLFWHMTRTEDVGINLIIAGRPQVLDTVSWGERLNVTFQDIGTGMTDSDVDIFSQQVNISALMAYRVAVGRQTQEIIRNLQPEVLEEKIGIELILKVIAAGGFGSGAEWVQKRWLGKQKGFTLMHTVLAHTYFHIGQCEDVRGLLGFATL